MNLFKKAINFYINSSIHVALAVTALTAVTSLSFLGVFNINILLFVFLGTISGYNFVKYAGIAKLHHYSLTKNLKMIQVFSLFAFLGLLYFFSLQSTNFLILTGFLGFCTTLYAIPFLPKQKNLRNLKGTKIFIIAFVWAGVCVLLPLIDEVAFLEYKVWVKWLQVFLFVISITIPFEIRDLKFDDDGLGTLPQLVGVKQVKRIGYSLIVLVIAMQGILSELEFIKILPVILIGILSAIFIKLARKQQREFYASFYVEAVPIIWFLLELGIGYIKW